MARERILLSVNVEKEDHKRALEILKRQKNSSEYVIRCILAYEEDKPLTRHDLHEELEAFLEKLPEAAGNTDGKRIEIKKQQEPEIPGMLLDVLKMI